MKRDNTFREKAKQILFFLSLFLSLSPEFVPVRCCVLGEDTKILFNRSFSLPEERLDEREEERRKSFAHTRIYHRVVVESFSSFS